MPEVHITEPISSTAEDKPPATNSTKAKSMGLLTLFPCLQGMIVKAIVKARVQPKRLSNPKTPAQYGMAYEEVSIQSIDGIRLSAWEIVQPGDKLAIVNHPLTCTRYGSVKGLDGVPVEFLPLLKVLYDAGYSIISYDQRGQGDSDGGLAGPTCRGDKPCPVGVGATEWQDALGVLAYTGAHATLGSKKIALVSHCMGANATMKAFSVKPDAFGANVKCMAAIQPTNSFEMVSRLTKLKLGKDIAPEVDAAQEAAIGEGFRKSGPDFASAVTVPTLFAQVKADAYTCDPGGVNDVQAIFDLCPAAGKEILWIGPDQPKPHGTGKRFEGYAYFNEHPEDLLDFLAKHM